MPFRMSSDDTVTRDLGEGPGPSLGGIANITNADQTSEGPGVKPGGIAGSAVAGKGIKRKLDAKSYETKYDAIMTVERGGKSKKQIAADFGIPMSTLSTWLKKSEDIKTKYLSGEMGAQRKKCRTAKFPEIEEALLKWFKTVRNQNVAISGDLLREKARCFATNLGISENDFECSSGWLERFKSRHNITFKKVCGESKSVDENSDEINDWKIKLANILKDYSPDQIYEIDDDLPLSQLRRIGLSSDVNFDAYATVDDNVSTSTQMTDNDIIEDIISSRNAAESVTSDEEDEPAPKRPPVAAVMSALDIITAQLEFLNNSSVATKKFNDVSNFIMKEHLLSLCVKQSDISEFMTPSTSAE